MSELNNSVHIIEVGPRDGLQNEKTFIPTEDKFSFILDLIAAGLKTIEVTSFVRPDRIPQMADAKELMDKINQSKDEKFKHVELVSLVPNIKGYENSQSVGVKNIALFSATSVLFNKKNINATIDESLDRFTPVIEKAKIDGVKIRGYISTVFGCPYEGKVNKLMMDQLYRIIQHYFDHGAYDVSLGDTIGIANPAEVEKICSDIKIRFGVDKLSLHFHDTKGRALANIWQGYQLGFRRFDASAGGLGGCPYAKGASGNVATEDVVDFFNSCSIDTGIDLNKVHHASSKVLKILGHQSSSKIHQFLEINKA